MKVESEAGVTSACKDSATHAAAGPDIHVCMTMGLLMLNPLLLFSHDDDLDMALLLCVQEVMQSKYVQSVQLHN